LSGWIARRRHIGLRRSFIEARIVPFKTLAVEPILQSSQNCGGAACEWNTDSQGGDRNLAFIRNRKVGPDVSHLNERSGANMLASPLPIYLGCAGLIVGSLGLGAHHMLGNGSGSPKDTAAEQPLFAKSVEQAALPTTQWPSKGVDVAYYGPMVELLTQPASSVPAPLADPSRDAAPQGTPQETFQQAPQGQQPPTRDVAPAPQSPSTTARGQEQPRAAPREVVRELPPQQSRQSRRARDQRPRDDARSSGETASTEQVDPREARTQETRTQETRTQERQRTATQVDTERREGRRSERRYRDRDDADEVDARSRSDRRGRDGERRVVVREETREPEQRVVRGSEQRELGFSPFRLFGIFEQR
jgi:hypothetical protein